MLWLNTPISFYKRWLIFSSTRHLLFWPIFPVLMSLTCLLFFRWPDQPDSVSLVHYRFLQKTLSGYPVHRLRSLSLTVSTLALATQESRVRFPPRQSTVFTRASWGNTRTWTFPGIQAPAWKGRTTGDNIISRGLNSYVVVDRVSDQIKVDLENVRPIEKKKNQFQ